MSKTGKEITRQDVVALWAHRVLGIQAFLESRERALRVVEEAVELAQSLEVEAADLHRLVDYVYRRDVGEPSQEIAGIMVTLYAAAASLSVDADAAFAKELARIHTPEVEEKVRRRQAEKRALLTETDAFQRLKESK